MPDKTGHADPEFEADLQVACSTGQDWASICTKRAIRLVLGGRPVHHCPACCRIMLAGKAFCWVAQCRVVFLCNGVGKDIINYAYRKGLMYRERSKFARASERTVEQKSVVAASATQTDEEELDADANRRHRNLCRVVIHGIQSSEGGTPRVALTTAMREQYNHRRKWRAKRERQLRQGGNGNCGYCLDEVRSVASKGRVPSCDEASYLQTSGSQGLVGCARRLVLYTISGSGLPLFCGRDHGCVRGRKQVG